jgi:protein-S-isoprenylcysteine O-methyltransferase Ste14
MEGDVRPPHPAGPAGPLVKPPVLFFGCIGLAAVLQYVRPRSLASYPFAAGMAAGGLLLVAAAGLGGAAFRELSRHGTPIEPGQAPSQLVTSGPFRFTRNPLYLAHPIVLLALAFMVNSLWFALGAPALLVLLDRLVVRREESGISEAMGARYDAYRARVRRWL